MSKKGTPFSAKDVSRLTTKVATTNGGKIPAKSIAAKAQHYVDTNAAKVVPATRVKP